MDARFDLIAAAIAASGGESEAMAAPRRAEIADVTIADAHPDHVRRDVEIGDDLLLADAPSRRVR